MKNKWLDRSLLESPCYYTLCTTEKQYAKELRRMKVPEPFSPFLKTSHSHATTHVLTEHRGKVCCIVCLGSTDGRRAVEVYGLLVHEAMHIWREVREHYGIVYPEAEQEAYAVQRIAQELIHEYRRQTKKGK